MKTLSADEIAALAGGRVIGNGKASVSRAAGLKEADRESVSFLANARYAPLLAGSRAGVVIIPEDVDPPENKTVVRCKDPSRAFTATVNELYSSSARVLRAGVASGVDIPESAVIGKGVYIGPNTTILPGVSIGDRTQVLGNVYIGEGVSIGADCWIFPGGVFYEGTVIGRRCAIHANTVVGSDGFGYLEDDTGGRTKIPQVGIVEIEDDVDIGANCAIDRARFEKTLIGRGTKIDNLVQIAHNVKIGQHTVIVSQAGISGSTEIGDQVIVAGQVGIVGHVTIGSRTLIGAKSGVAKSVPEGSRISGYYATDHHRTMKELASLRKLPEFMSKVKSILKRFPE